MIIISSNNEFEAFTNAYKSLYNSKLVPSDQELLKEEYLVLEIDSPNISSRLFINKNAKFQTNFDYDTYISEGSKFAIEEGIYWEKEMFSGGPDLYTLIDYLKESPESKRAIKIFWKDEYRDLRVPASCISQIFFRIKYDKLEMHVLMRANDAYRCLLIDIDSLRAVQDFVAKQLGLKIGKYIHSVNSFHFYKERQNNINELYKKLTN